VSYGFYLWHLALLTVVAGNAKWALGDHGLIANPSGVGVTASWQLISLAVAIAFVASLVVAWISWQWIERPFIRRSHSTASETSSIR
jgi:peptidoglycan/LPS O-acetylase OafA/YrhL